MPTIQIDCYSAANHDNYTAIPAINSVVSAGNVINSAGAVVSGVAISLAANPFGIAINSGMETPSFAEVNNTAEQTQFIHESRVTPAIMVVSGLPAATYSVTVFGWRNVAENRIGELILNGRSAVQYNAGNLSMTYAAHTAVDTVTLTGGQNLTLQIQPAVGSGSAHVNAIFISWPDEPSITNIDGDNTVNQGQQSVTINMANVPTSVASWSASIGGNALTTVSWNANQTATVHIPANLAAGGSQQLSVTYTE